MDRRGFIVGSTVTLVSTVAGYSYLFSKCPLDTEGDGICTGPCTAFIDLNGDGACDRLPAPATSVAQAEDGQPIVERVCPLGLVNDPYPGECNLYVDADGDGICDLSQNHLPSAQNVEQPVPSDQTTTHTACPLGLVNDPYPGECNLYVDADGDGICDLSQNHSPSAQNVEQPVPSDQTSAHTACPLGLVNDPYPGQCRWYVDDNGNSICDLSEPELVSSGAVASPPDNGTASGGGTQQRRRHGRNN